MSTSTGLACKFAASSTRTPSQAHRLAPRAFLPVAVSPDPVTPPSVLGANTSPSRKADRPRASQDARGTVASSWTRRVERLLDGRRWRDLESSRPARSGSGGQQPARGLVGSRRGYRYYHARRDRARRRNVDGKVLRAPGNRRGWWPKVVGEKTGWKKTNRQGPRPRERTASTREEQEHERRLIHRRGGALIGASADQSSRTNSAHVQRRPKAFPQGGMTPGAARPNSGGSGPASDRRPTPASTCSRAEPTKSYVTDASP